MFVVFSGVVVCLLLGSFYGIVLCRLRGMVVFVVLVAWFIVPCVWLAWIGGG